MKTSFKYLEDDPQYPIENFKRKTLHILLGAFAGFALLSIGFALLGQFTAPDFITVSDARYFTIAGLFFLLSLLIIWLVDRFLSFNASRILFILLVIVGLFLADSMTELLNGRSLAVLVIPVALASVLLKPWVGLVVASLYSVLIIWFTLSTHVYPNIPAIIVLLLIALIIQQATLNMEKAMQRELDHSHAIQESRDRFQKITEVSPNGILTLSLDGKITSCNDTFFRMFGFMNKQDPIGMEALSLVHPDERDKFSNYIEHLLQASKLSSTDVKCLRPDGEIFFVVINSAIISDWEGKSTSIVVMLRDITEDRQAELKLRESEELFSKAFHLSPMPMALTELDGRYIDINHSFTQTVGYLPEDVIGKVPSQVPIFLDNDQNKVAIRILREQGRMQSHEMILKTKSGEVLTGMFFAEPIKLSGRLLVLTIMIDITERKRIENELREHEEEYRALITSLPIGVIVHEAGNIQLINPTAMKSLGISDPKNIVGKPIQTLVHPDFQKAVVNRIKETSIKGVSGEIPYEKLMRLDGTTIDVDIKYQPVYLNGKRYRLIMFDDITERKHSEEALQKSEENFRLLSENMADGILIGAPDGKHVYANLEASRLLGYSPDEMVKTHQADLVDPDTYPLVKKRLSDRIAGKHVPESYEINLRRKDGSILPAEIKGTRTLWQGQMCDLVFIRNITERRLAQDAIRKKNERIQEVSRQLVEIQEREKRSLASELHDDLGQALTSLKLMLELAATSRSPRWSDKSFHDTLALVSELMGKVRNLSLDLRPAMLDDFGLLAATRWLIERFHTQTGIKIHSNLDLADDQRFSPAIETAAFRIIQEALTNVIKHAGVQVAEVNIRVSGNLTLEITDHGIGFDHPTELQASTNSFGITGMQERARLLGGQVEIISHKGGGTHIIASLPLEEGAHE